MKIMNSRFYGLVETVSNFFLLNLLWILFSIPLITLFPATAAMFAILRDWKMGKNPSLLSSYFTYFKDFFKQSTLIGLCFSICIGILVLDFMFMDELNTVMRIFVFSVILLSALILMFIGIYFFPTLVYFQMSFKHSIKNAFLYSIMYLPATIISISIFVTMVVIVYLVPIFSLIAFSVTAYIVYLLCHRNFEKTFETSGVFKRS
ncbi:YesL family protein [Lederbergia citrea]|uniref:YesL family protein n=1 Tax=Lederbergia citrea TaxID=2833581 RepID=UPI001BCA3C97|nr:DUF624 domain-containing protein [Lederbergia citrea]MBS4178990.1 DUF624 domain-containing protein [Lederbergia citrea]